MTIPFTGHLVDIKGFMRVEQIWKVSGNGIAAIRILVAQASLPVKKQFEELL